MANGPYLIDAARYKWLHSRIAQLYGRASEYSCSRCYHQHAAHWACLGDYEDFEEYWPLCVPCHWQVDVRERMQTCRAGKHPWTSDHYRTKTNGRRFCNSCKNERRRKTPAGAVLLRDDKGRFTPY